MEILSTSIFVFILSLIFALLEIEIEGKNGWAKNLPTWYKKSGFSKIFYCLAGKKTLNWLSFVYSFIHALCISRRIFLWINLDKIK